MQSDLMTRREAVTYLALDRQGLRDPLEALRWLCRTGKLRYVKVGRHICFRKAWLDGFVNRQNERHGRPKITVARRKQRQRGGDENSDVIEFL